MTTYRIDPTTITPNAAIDLLEQSISEIAHYISHYFDRSMNPYRPNDAPTSHFSDDDTDYLPAANDLLTTLIAYRCDDYAYDDDPAKNTTLDLIRRIATCDLDPTDHHNATDMRCFHQTANECDFILNRFFAPEYDDCPHNDA